MLPAIVVPADGRVHLNAIYSSDLPTSLHMSEKAEYIKLHQKDVISTIFTDRFVVSDSTNILVSLTNKCWKLNLGLKDTEKRYINSLGVRNIT